MNEEILVNKIRWKSFDCLKGLACIAVVFIHYNYKGDLGTAIKTFCRFAVPIFFISSGFFFLYDGKMDDMKTINKIRHILKLVLGAGIFYVLFTIWQELWLNPEWNAKTYIFEKITADRIVKFFLTNDPFIYSHLWFLLALIYCYVFSLLFFEKNKRLSWIKVIAPVLLIMYSCLQEFGNTLQIQSSVSIPGTESRLMLFNLFIFRALPFFLFGILLRSYQTEISRIYFNNAAGIILFILGGIIAIIERFKFSESQFFLGTYLMVTVMILFAIKNPDYDNKVLGYIGRELSLYVYIFHIAVGKIINIFVYAVDINDAPIYIYGRPFWILVFSLVIAFLVNILKTRLGEIKKEV